MYLCNYTDKDLNDRFGMIRFPKSKALQLEQEGKIKIVDKNDTITKVIHDYKTNDTQLKSNHLQDKKKKIAWVQDNSKEGGAEISNKRLRTIGLSLGFAICLITPQQFDYSSLLTADLIIIYNIFEFSPEQYKKIYHVIYELRKPYIKYDHDHREMKRPYIATQLFTLSKLNIFLSPEHKKRSIEVYGKQIERYSIALPLSIDNNFYINKGLERKDDSVFIPCLRKCHKNFLNYFEQNKNLTYTIISDNNFISNSAKQKVIKRVTQNEMINLYNTHKYMFHEPDSFWAGERIYFESLLCGCIPIVNDNVGHYSWGKDYNLDNLKSAGIIFWKQVDNVIESRYS